MVGQLSASLAHEISQPVQTMQACLEVVRFREKGGDQNPVRAKDLDRLEQQAKRLAKLVKTIRSTVREGQKDHDECIEITNLLHEVQDLMKDRLLSVRAKLEMQCIPPDLTVTWNSVHITQVLVNLMSNAIDAIEPLSERWIRIDATELSRGGIRITCTDSGRGIPAPIAKNMFRPLFTTKANGRGTGLGLGFCKMLVERRSGTILHNPECSNTQFVVELPAQSQSTMQSYA